MSIACFESGEKCWLPDNLWYRCYIIGLWRAASGNVVRCRGTPWRGRGIRYHVHATNNVLTLVRHFPTHAGEMVENTAGEGEKPACACDKHQIFDESCIITPNNNGQLFFNILKRRVGIAGKAGVDWGLISPASPEAYFLPRSDV